MKNKLICIVAFSASGKDSVANILSKKHGFKIAVSHTTRPMRSGEKEGVQYYFISDKVMESMINNNEFIEYREYHTIKDDKPDIWKYGMSKHEIDLSKNTYIMVVDVHGCKDMINYLGRDNVTVIFLDVPYEQRKIRAMARDKHFELAEFDRREESDKERFKDLDSIVDYRVANIVFDNCISNIEKYLAQEEII